MAVVSVASKIRAALVLLVGSVFAGVLVSLLAVPSMLVATGMVNTTAEEWNNVALDLVTPPQQLASKVYMADGSLLATFSDEYREYVTLDKIAPLMQKAQVAIEDKRFYEHGAIDPIGLFRTAIGHLLHQSERGASSITQQYVKLVRIQVAQQNKDKVAEQQATALTLSRKIVEMRYAMALEKQLTKDQILERYLNIAYYGGHAYGVQAAAFHYFNTTAADLTLPQAAVLAGLVQAPSAYDPTQNLEAATSRRNTVLTVMAEPDVAAITPAQAKEAKASPIELNVQSIANGCYTARYPFICQYVQNTLLGDAMAPSLGLTANSSQDARQTAINEGGYSIYTIIDPVAQDQTQEAVSSKVDPRDPVIGVAVLVQPSTGQIIAMAQSRPVMGYDTLAGETFKNYAVGTDMGGMEGFQTGSTFKIFTLANAISLGVQFDTMYDTPASMNYQGRVFQSCAGPFTQTRRYPVAGGGGIINLLTGTANSVNNYFVQLEMDTGICGAVRMAQAAGVTLAMPTTGVNGYSGPPSTDLLTTQYDYAPSFTLGVAYVSPLTMASAYATFANNGMHCDPVILASMKDASGKDVPVPSANCKQTIDPNVVAGVDVALQGVIAHGTGTVARVPGGWPQAGKSGTTDGPISLSFAGYTPHVAGFAIIAIDNQDTGFWNGRAKNMSHLTLPFSKTYLRGTGAPDAGQIWKAAMGAALQDKPKDGFPKFYPIITGWSSTNTVAPAPPPPPPDQQPPPAPPA